MAAITAAGEVLLVATPSGPAVVRSKSDPVPAAQGSGCGRPHRGNRCSLVIVTSGLPRWQKMQTCWGMIRKLASARDALRQVTGPSAITLRDSHGLAR